MNLLDLFNLCFFPVFWSSEINLLLGIEHFLNIQSNYISD